MISDLQSDARSIRTNTYNLLTRVSTWPAFSNHTPGDGGSSSSSLEAIHDGIHGDVGAGGHMGDPFVAAFDPIFFLHHCNVDRILALWEALHPTTWVTSGPANGGTFTMAGNATETATTDLTPFWNGATTFWNSNACRDFEKSLNYTYPEFAGLSGQDANTVRAKIGAIVNQLYGASSRQTFAFAAAGAQGATGQSVAPAVEKILNAAPRTAAAPPAAMRLFATPAASPAATPAAAPAAGSQVHVQIAGGGDRQYNDWSARIHAKKFELSGSYSVLIFLGPVPTDPKEWRASPSYVGAHHVFANSRMEDCENCRRNSTENVEGFVSLNEAIAAHSGLNSFDPAVVEPYLKKELSWRVQKADRSAVDLSQLPSLQVVVVALPLHLHEGEIFPKTGTPVHHHGITEEYREWTARIRVNEYELGGSFSILIFLGEIPDDPAEWRSSPNYVGAHSAFVSVESGDRRNDPNAITEGFVSLNSAIASKPGLNSYDPKEVVPYLQRNLGWRIQKADRSPVDVSEVPSLQIVVIATPMRMREGEPFPEQCGDPKHHHEVTSGKPGGCYE
ncbi:hypothetical protein FRC05_009523 [Tulasnella sp. 425]|nr:hypothetical protein FRC05_009523 [Tulasnella sp. 425]